jgi:RNA polymerase sigma factor (sigma-70 family)
MAGSLSPSPTDEEALVEAAVRGDLDAFNQLVLRFQNTVFSLAYRMMGDAASADDTAQEAFINAYRKLETYRGGSFRAWLLRIATNTCYDELRRRKRRPATAFEDLPGGETDDGPPLPASTPTPEESAQNSELSRVLQDCINGLQEDQRVTLVMCDVQGYSYQEIAWYSQIQIEPGTCRNARLFTAGSGTSAR